MSKYYVITMSDGSEWGVPAETIARNRADYYEDIEPGCWQYEYDEMMVWFDTANRRFAEWAQTCMDWDDVKEYAVCLKEMNPVVDFQDGWFNGECAYKNIPPPRKGISYD